MEQTATKNGSMIRLEGVTRTFAVGSRTVIAVQNITLGLQQGAFVVLMGPSGSGKTTLLNLIGGLDRPTSGTVSVAGQRLDTLSNAALTTLRRQIGFMFQGFALIPSASAYENVELGLRLAGTLPRAQWDARIQRCLHAVGLMSWADHRPYELSGGQQQRVAVARALAIRPRLMLADEPTSNLDSTTGRQILSLLRALADHEGMTMVLATHDPAAADFATELYQLRDGRIVARER